MMNHGNALLLLVPQASGMKEDINGSSLNDFVSEYWRQLQQRGLCVQ